MHVINDTFRPTIAANIRQYYNNRKAKPRKGPLLYSTTLERQLLRIRELLACELPVTLQNPHILIFYLIRILLILLSYNNTVIQVER